MNKFTLPAGTTNRHKWHQSAMSAVEELSRIRFMRRELYGVKGGEERESLVSTMFAGIENETADQLLNEIGNRFSWSITKDSADQVAEAIKKAIPEAMEAIPVDDNREEPEEKAARLQANIDRNKQYEAEQTEKQAQTQIFIDELKKEYPNAVPDNGKISGYARASKNIKKELLAIYPHVKFSVTSSSFSMGNSISVSWDNGPSPKEVDKITDKYAYYIDKYTDDNSAYSNAIGAVLGQAKYVSTQRHISQDIRDQITLDIRSRCDEPDHRISELVWRSLNQVNITGRYAGIDLVNGEYVAQFEVEPEPEPEPPKPTKKTCEGVTVSEGTRSGFSQIEFNSKPSAEIRSELKAAGYRWSPKNSVWYGKTDFLPSRYEAGEEISTEQAHDLKINKTNGDKFRSLADAMQADIDNKLGDRLTNTPKRIAQAAHARLDGERLQRTQSVLYALADMQDAQTVPQILQGLTSKKAIYNLMGEKSEPRENGFHSYHVGTGQPSQDTPQAIALWGLLTGKTEEEKQAEELKRKIESLQFSNIAGYFPTPDPVIDIMFDYAQLEEHHAVLEPSAGSGAISDRVKAELGDHGILHCYEINNTLNDILTAKGHTIAGGDFMQQVDRVVQIYDRVLMNPPFENLQDVDHVLHAFRFLKSGGRLVSVMSPSFTYNSNKKALAFRQWVDDNGGEVVELPEGSFKASGTGVNTVLLIIDKE